MLLSRRTFLSSLGGASALLAQGRAFAARAPRNLIVSGSGYARIGGKTFRCALGRSGIRRHKAEGDGATPLGTWPLREVYFRADRLAIPKSKLPLRAMQENDGWCDAPSDSNYNRHVIRPYPASAEALWRDDHLYDLVIVVGYNDAPVTPGGGSAIFLHVARPNYAPTAGCVAFKLADLLKILSRLDPQSSVDIRA